MIGDIGLNHQTSARLACSTASVAPAGFDPMGLGKDPASMAWWAPFSFFLASPCQQAAYDSPLPSASDGCSCEVRMLCSAR